MTPLERFNRHRAWAVTHANHVRVPASTIERDDVVSAALYGLWKACQKLAPEYDDRSTDEFQRAAWTWVRGAIFQLIRDCAWVKRSQHKAGVRIELLYDVDFDRIERSPDYDDGPDDAHLDLLRRVYEAVDRLGPTDQRVVRECVLAERPLHDLARELGVTPPRISQRLRRAVDTIRDELQKTA